MAVLTNNFDAGTEGAVITSANSASSGTAFSSTVLGAPTYAAAAAVHGGKGMQIPGGQTSDQSVRWNASGATEISFRYYLTLSGSNSGEVTIVRGATIGAALSFRLTAGSATTNKRLRLMDSAGSAVFSSSADLPMDTVVRIEFHFKSAGGSSVREMAYYLGDSTTPVQSWNDTTDFAPSSGWGDVIFGQYGSGNYSSGMKIDDPILKTGVDASMGLPGPYANIPPSVTMPSNQTVAASAAVSLTATDSDSDGTIASRAWTMTYPASGGPSLSGAATATVTFTAGSAGSLYILQYAATDNGGATTTGTVEVRVPSTSSTVSILPGWSGSGASGWTIVGGSATQGDALNDGNSATAVDAPAMTSTASERKWRLVPMAARTSFSWDMDGFLTAVGSHTSLTRLYSGTTLIKEASLAYTGSASTITTTLNGTEIGNITDWGALHISEVAVL